ncbi:MAG: CRISPR-associated protein Cas4 [Leptospiraceae bacterium]|nr:CRISPR-associated protein Cas4 [Leptospiraceae bacterium]
MELDWNENEIVPISAISHHLYCPRQNALIHVAGVFIENDLTASGRLGHAVVDTAEGSVDHGLRRETSLRVFSDDYGMAGIADLVEFPDGAPPFPVDYKHGRVASWLNHEAQLCAIGICLEEMLKTTVPAGAIYHLYSRKRHTVQFSEQLRVRTLAVVEEVRQILRRDLLPAAVYGPKCARCSLKPACLPEVVGRAVDGLFVRPEDA